MTKAWKEVIASPRYQQLTPAQQAEAQEQYFNEVIAPRAGENAGAARQQFFAAYPSAIEQHANPASIWSEPPSASRESAAWGNQRPRTRVPAHSKLAMLLPKLAAAYCRLA